MRNNIYKIVSLYSFFSFKENLIIELKEKLFSIEKNNDLSGLLIIAREGLNGTICAEESIIDNILKFIKNIVEINELNIKVSYSKKKIYKKLKIKIKDEIVTMGVPEINPLKDSGTYIDSIRWNKLIKDQNTIVIDTRNHYEVSIGSFNKSINPNTESFSEFPNWVDDNLEKYLGDEDSKNIAMYCTGGIRCEKASAYLKSKGLKNVYQLQGGIIEYTRQIKDKNLKNNFLGKNFVFDERRAETVSEDIVSNCHQCGEPCDSHVNCANESCHLLFIQCKKCRKKMNHCCSNQCMSIIELSYEEQKKIRKGKYNSNKIFKKGRSNKLKYKLS